jgi:hypothetical protein
MAVKLSPFGPKPHFEDSSGNPLSGGLLYFYVAGSSTAQDTYTTSAGTVANANPVVLDSRGEPGSQIWFTEDTTYKAVLKTSAGVEIWSSDNLSGINDTSVAQDEWVGGTTPTYISATSFSVTGDQSSIYHVGRRLKSTNTAGTIYSTITAVAYVTVTTVTVVNDSGSLDSGMSAVSYGLLSATNPSTPLLTDAYPVVSGSSDKTKKLRLEADNLTTATTRVLTAMDKDATIAPAEDITRPFNVTLAASVATNILTIALKTRDGGDPSAGDPAFIPFRSATATTGDYTVIKQTAALSIAIPDTATLGTVNADMARLYVYAVNDGGTLKLGVYNPVSGSGNTVSLKSLNVGDVQSSTVIGTGSDSAQTLYTDTAGVTSKAVCWLGFVEIVEATAGTWATAPTLVTLAGNGVNYTGDLVQVVNDVEETGSTTTSATAVDVTGASASITPSSRCNLLECHVDYAQICANQTAVAAGSTAFPADGADAAYRNAKTIKTTDTTSEPITKAGGAFHFYAKPDSTSAQVVKLRHTSINGSDTITTSGVGIMVKEIFA